MDSITFACLYTLYRKTERTLQKKYAHGAGTIAGPIQNIFFSFKRNEMPSEGFYSCWGDSPCMFFTEGVSFPFMLPQ